MRRLRRLTAGLAAFSFAASARAEAPNDQVPWLVPPWSAVAVEPWPNALRTRDGEQSLHVAPSASAPRRGSVAEGVFLPAFGAMRGPGCRTPWFHVGPEAWACADHLEPSLTASRFGEALPGPDGLPFRYYFAREGGARGYRRIVDFDAVEPAFEYEQGFAVAIVAEQVVLGERYGLTRRGVWVRLSEFGPAHASTFEGVRWEGDSSAALADESKRLPTAWVVVDRAPVYRRNGASFRPSGEVKARFDRVDFLDEQRVFASSFVRIGEDRWLRASDLRHPNRASPPVEIATAGEVRWLDIELETQTLVAYEGTKPVFATLVSTGRGKAGTKLETPRGLHRIWVKLLATTMDNLEDPNASNYYRIEDVPYVQFFAKGVGIHAAFWHKSFGHVRSHGCVNVAPLDAAFLFRFTGPYVPPGWSAALPTRFDSGTWIRVR